MITKVGTVSVFVSDQDRAKAFYTDILGFELRRDAPLFPGATSRWLAVAPHGSATEIILYLLDENWGHYKQVLGKSQAMTFEVENISSLHTDLVDKGVKIIMGPDAQPWGTFLMIEDSEGNHLILTQPVEP